MFFKSRFAVALGIMAAAGFWVASAGTAKADVITFDEFPATNNNVPLTAAYAGQGVTFDTRNSGTWGGNANGNPGNWGVNGTNGPQFLGNNGLNNGNTYVESIFFFSTAQADVSFDASRTNGSSPGQTLIANAYDASSNLVATETFTLGAINTWSTFDLAGAGITRVDLLGSTAGFSPYAIDNLQFNAAGSSVPEPGSLVLLGTGLVSLAGVVFRRRLNASMAQ